jgi:hypothetical protein
LSENGQQHGTVELKNPLSLRLLKKVQMQGGMRKAE